MWSSFFAAIVTSFILVKQVAASSCSTSCSRTLYIEELAADISSPCYPGNYLQNLNCRTEIQSDGTNLTQIQITAFNLEPWHDFLKLYGVTSFLLFINSTTKNVIITGYPIGNITALFSTDSSINKFGYNATVRAISESDVLNQYNSYHAEGAAHVLNSPVYLSSSGDKGMNGEAIDLMFLNIPNTTDTPIQSWNDYTIILANLNESAVLTFNVTATGFTAKWMEVSGSISYNVSVFDSDGNILKSVVTTETVQIFSDLPSGSDYNISVKITDKLGNVGYFSGNTTTDVLSPTNLRVTDIKQTNFMAIWDAVDGATSYRCDYDANGVSYSKQTENASFLVTGLSPGSLYTINIFAIFPVGVSDASSIQQITVPESVSNLHLVHTTYAVNVSWTGATGASDYRVTLHDEGNGSQILITTDTKILIGNLSPGIDHYLSIESVNAGGKSPAVGTNFTTVPSSVSELRVVSLTTSASVSWSGVKGVLYYTFTLSGDVREEISNTTDINITVPSLLPGTDYFLKVEAVNTAGVSPPTSLNFTTELLPFGASIEVASITTDSFVLNWTSIPGAIYYELTVSEKRNMYNCTHKLSVNESRKSFTNLPSGSLFEITLKVYNRPTNYKTMNGTATTGMKTPDNTSVTTITQTSFRVSWSTIKGAIHYQINATSDGSIIHKETSSNSAYLDNLSPGTVYNLSILAIFPSGTSSPSSRSQITVPSSVSELRVVYSTTSVSTWWNGTKGVSYYTLTLNGGERETIINTMDTNANMTTLLPGTDYSLKVEAVNSAGVSSPASLNFTTELLPSGASIEFASATMDGFVLNWTSIPGATYYELTVLEKRNMYNSTHKLSVNETRKSFINLPSGSLFEITLRVYNRPTNYKTMNGTAKTEMKTPGNVSVTAVTQTSFRVSWSAIKEAIHYQVNATSDANIVHEIALSPSVLLNRLSPGTLYNLSIFAIFPAGISLPSIESQITVPGNISNLTISSILTTSFTPYWSSIKCACSYSMTIIRNKDNAWKKEIGNVTSGGSITNVEPGITYTVYVSATNVAGNSAAASATFSTELIPQSTMLTVRDETTDSFVIEWPVIDGATQYTISVKEMRNLYNKAETITGNTKTVNSLPSGSFFNITLTVIGKEPENNATLTHDAKTAVTPPSGINAVSTTQTSFNLGWTKIVGALKYKIKASEGANIISKESPIEQIKIDNLLPGTEYNLEIVAEFPVGASAPAVKKQKTAPGNITDLTVKSTTTSFTPKWTAVTGATSYLLNLKRTRDNQDIKSDKQVSIEEVVGGVRPGTHYTLDVTAVNDAGGSFKAFETFTTNLSTPTEVKIVAITKNRFLLTWKEVDGANQYEYSCTDKIAQNTTETQVAVEDLKSNQQYTCEVAALTPDMKSLKSSYSERTAMLECDKSPCLNGGICKERDTSGFDCQCTSAYEGKTCENVRNWCEERETPCPGNATCFNDVNILKSRCECNAGFTGDAELRCVAFCPDSSMVKDNVTLTFNTSYTGRVAHSTEKCDGRSKASVVCVTTFNGNTAVSEYPESGVTLVKCGTTVDDVVSKVTDTTTDSKKLTEQTKKLEVLTSGDALKEDDVSKVAEYIDDVAKISGKSKNTVTVEILSGIVNTADNLISSKSISFLQTAPTPTPATPKPGNPPPPTEAPISAAQKEKEIKQNILKSLTILAEQVTIPNDTDEVVIETKSMIVKVIETPVFVQNSSDPQPQPQVTFAPVLTKFTGRQTNGSNVTETQMSVPLQIRIPGSAIVKANKEISETTKEKIRISFLLHKDDTLFPSRKNPEMIIAANLGSNVTLKNLEEDVIVTYEEVSSPAGISNSSKPMFQEFTEYECVYWDFDTGSWSAEGCCIDFDDLNLSTCRCDHLTNYAVLVSKSNIPADLVLDIVSDIGCALSIFGLICTIIIHCLKEDIRKKRPIQLLLHTCFCLLFSYVIFIAGMSVESSSLSDNVCVTIAALLQYFYLATWCWMSVYANDMYRSFLKVFNSNTSGYMTKCVIFAYGFPLLITLTNACIAVLHFDANNKYLSLCPNKDGYSEEIKSKFPRKSAYVSPNFCWIHDFSLYIGFLLPVALMLVFNIFVSAMVMKTLLNRASQVQSSAKQTTAKDHLLISITLAASTGLTWIVGYLMLLSEDPTYLLVTSWIFAIFNTTQGLVIFFTTCVRHENMRKIWWNPIRDRCCGMCSRIKMISPKREGFSLATSEGGATSFVSGSTENTKNTMVAAKSIITTNDEFSATAF
ncbi:fibronectin-like isoform X1 [Styela clava]